MHPMNNFEFTLRLLILLFSFSAVTVSMIFYIQFKKPLALHFSGFTLGLTTLLIAEFVSFLNLYIADIWTNKGAISLYILTTPSYTLITYFGISFVNSLKRNKLNLNMKLFILLPMFILTVIEEIGIIHEKFLMIPVVVTFIYMLLVVVKIYKNSTENIFRISVKVLYISIISIILSLSLVLFNIVVDLALVIIYLQSLTLSFGAVYFSFKFFSSEPYLKDGEITEAFVEVYKITSREMDVLSLMVKGEKNQDIANELCVSLRTITTHVSNIYKKLSVKNRVQLLNLFNNNWS